jgi:hypothetical protein
MDRQRERLSHKPQELQKVGGYTDRWTDREKGHLISLKSLKNKGIYRQMDR